MQINTWNTFVSCSVDFSHPYTYIPTLSFPLFLDVPPIYCPQLFASHIPRPVGGPTLEKNANVTNSYIHTYIHTYVRTYKCHRDLCKTHTYIYTYVHKYIHTYVHKYIHTYTHTYIHTHTVIFAKQTRTYIHTYIHTCGTYTHTYIHTYIPEIHRDCMRVDRRCIYS